MKTHKILLISACLSVLVFAPGHVFADTTFSISTGAQTVPVDTSSGAITLTASAAVAQTTCLLLSSTSSTGQFSSSATNWSPVVVLTMNKNTSNRTFYYKDSTEGSYTLVVNVAPRPDSMSTSCASWSDAASNVQGSATQTIVIGTASATPGDTQPQTSQTQNNSVSTPAAPAPTASASPVGTTGTPPITAHISGDATSMVGGGSYFSGTAFGTQGAPLSNVRYLWNFGDGTTAEGQTAFHIYSYPGKYEVALSAASDISAGLAHLAVEATVAQVALVAEADGSLSVSNQSSKDLDIGLWSLANGPSSFVIPKNTTVLAQKGVRFAFAVTGVAGDANAKLLYPNGAVAAVATQRAALPATSTMPVVLVPKARTLAARNVPLPPTPPAVAATLAATSAEDNTANAAAAAASGVSMPTSAWVLGLAGLLVLGVAGVWYVRLHTPAAPETPPGEDEFDIE